MFGKKINRRYVVKQRSKDDMPFIIPHISKGGDDEVTDKNQFVSPMYGTNVKDEIIVPASRPESVAKYDYLRQNPVNNDREQYNEFSMIGGHKHIVKEEPKEEEAKPALSPEALEEAPVTEMQTEEKEIIPEPAKKEEPASPSFIYNIPVRPVEPEEKIEIKPAEPEMKIEESPEEEYGFKYDDSETIKADATLHESVFGVGYEKETKIIHDAPLREEPKETINIIESNYSKPEAVHEEKVNNDAKPVKMEKPEKMQYANPDGKWTYEELAIINSGHNPLDYKNYKQPPMDLLEAPEPAEAIDRSWVDTNIQNINDTLKGFKIAGEVVEYTLGPTFTRYSIKLAPGVSGSRINTIQTDLQRTLEATSLRIQNPIPGKAYVGIEVPNKKRRKVCIRELIDRQDFFDNDDPLYIPIGLDVEGKCKFISIGSLPHALVAGSSGSGKSVFINSVVTSLMYKNSPDEVRFFFIDPKQVDLQAYKNIPHLLSPIVSDVKGGMASLKWLKGEMDRRFKVFKTVGCANIYGYRKKRKESPELKKMPFIIAIIDECGDFLMNAGNEGQDLLQTIIQLCRAAGIHIFLSTQKPVAKVLSSSIKSNAQGRFAFRVTSQSDSFVILDEGGAESLLGRGDMIFKFNDVGRYQAAFIDDDEVRRITAYVASQGEQDFYFTVKDLEEKENTKNPGKITDEEFYKVARFVVDEQECSTNQICKNFNFGYNRANTIVEQLEYYQIVSENKGTRAREVLLTREELEEVLARIKEDNAEY